MSMRISLNGISVRSVRYRLPSVAVVVAMTVVYSLMSQFSLGGAQVDIRITQAAGRSTVLAESTVPRTVIRSARVPRFVEIDLGATSGRPAVPEEAVEKIVRVLDENPRRLVTLRLKGGALQFGGLGLRTQEALLQKRGESVVELYNRYIASQVLQLVEEIREERPRSPLAVYGLPFEGRGSRVQAANEAYRPVLARSSALVLGGGILASDIDDEVRILRRSFPNASATAGGRAILFAANGGWRIAMNVEDSAFEDSSDAELNSSGNVDLAHAVDAEDELSLTGDGPVPGVEVLATPSKDPASGGSVASDRNADDPGAGSGTTAGQAGGGSLPLRGGGGGGGGPSGGIAGEESGEALDVDLDGLTSSGDDSDSSDQVAGSEDAGWTQEDEVIHEDEPPVGGGGEGGVENEGGTGQQDSTADSDEGDSGSPGDGDQDSAGDGQVGGGSDPPGDSADDAPLDFDGTAPVVAWATIPSWSYVGERVPCALVIVDEWDGIASVRFQFSHPVVVNGQLVDDWLVSTSVWDDVFGVGQSAEYWCCWIDSASMPEEIAVGAVITRVSGEIVDVTASLGERVIRRAPSAPVTMFVDSVAGSDQNSGRLGWLDAKRTLGAATSASGVDVDQVILREGEYEVLDKIQLGAARERHLVIRGESDSARPVVRWSSQSAIASNIQGWLAFDGIDIIVEQGPFPDLSIYGSNVVFRDCRILRAAAGPNEGSILVTAPRDVSFVGCELVGGNRGIVVGATNGNPSAGLIMHAVDATGMGTAIRVQYSNSLIEYLTSHGNVKEPHQWDPSTHFNMCNAGDPRVDGALENVVFRGIRNYDNGTSEKNYSFVQLWGVLRNVAIVDSFSYGYQHSQQALHVTDLAVASNLQFSGLVIGAIDDPRRGITIGAGGTYQNVLLTNSAATVFNLPVDRATWYTAGNLASGYSVEPMNGMIDSDFLNGNALLPGLLAGDATPASGSVLRNAGVWLNRRFDVNGQVRGAIATVGPIE